MKCLAGGLALSLLLAMGLAPHAQAATTNGNFQASATVAASCTIVQMNNVSFGEYDPVARTVGTQWINQSHTMRIQCTAGSSGVQVALSKGLNPWPAYSCGAPRRRAASAEGNLLTYYFYSDAGRTKFWGCPGFTGNETAETLPPFTDSLNAREITIYSRMYGAQDVPVGNYSDTVDVSVVF